jgi:hypothetical protein
MADEHLYWDQASVLVQLGLRGGLPMVGAEGPLDELIHRAKAR